MMQGNFDNNFKLDDEDISKQLEQLRLGILNNEETKSEISSDELRSESFEDETEIFDESLEFENDFTNYLESDEEDSLADEFSLDEEDSMKEKNSLDEEEMESNDMNESLNAQSRLVECQREDYTAKLKSIQDELNSLKDQLIEFTKNLRSEISEIIFNQFDQLEEELLDNDENE